MYFVLSLIHTKNTSRTHAALLWLFCALLATVPAAALSVEEVEPKFEATERHTEYSDRFVFDTCWETSLGEFRIYQICSPVRNYGPASVRDGYIAFEISNEKIFSIARCSANFSAPKEPGITLDVLGQEYSGGFDDSRWSISSAVAERLKNQLPISVKASTGSPNDPVELLLLPPAQYQISANRYIEFVEQENVRIARETAIREEERKRKRKQRRETAEKVGNVIMVIFAVFLLLGVLGICLGIYRSRVIQKGFRKSLDVTSEKIEKTKQLYRRRRSLSTAKELSLWVELRDKGEITQEEFEKRKRDLME